MNNIKMFKKTMITGAIMAGLAASTTAQAANWLMLQGTEPAAAAGRAKVWGFVQAQYQKDDSDPNGGGGYIPPKLIGPNLDSQDQFNVNRARIGVRGEGMPLDSSVNYFVLAELGNNGITAPGDGDVQITDASITLNLNSTRIRAGLFKTPGPEEALQAIHVFDYINFTSVTNQMMLERFPQDGDGPQPATPTPNASMGQYSRAVGAVRDVGIQFFDSFKSSGWEHSYALMIGNGNGLNFGDNDDNKDTYLYWSSELALGGKGPRAEGLKLFAWSHNGKRTDTYNADPVEQDRDRSGVGVRYLKKPFRVGVEFMQGEGVIFQGQHRPHHVFNDEEADGYYVDFGWYIPNSNWELDLRIDSYTRGENFLHPSLTNSVESDESTFDTTTIGAQYHINKKTRINMEYSDRSFESDTNAVNAQLEGVGTRLAIQLTHIF